MITRPFYSLSLLWKRYKKLVPFFVGSMLLPLCVFPFLPNWDLAKFILLYFLAALSFLFVFRNNSIFIPRVNSFQKYLISALLTLVAYNYFIHKISFFEIASLERLLFWILFFYYCYALSFFRNSEKKYMYIPLFISTGIFLSGAFLSTMLGKGSFAFTFYNINKAAEFVGFSLALQLGLLFYFKGKGQKFLLLLIVMSLIYLYFSQCRSAFLGIIFCLIYLLWRDHFSIFRKFFFYVVFGSISLMLFLIILELNVELPYGKMWNKVGSSSERWEMILNTLSLIRDFPLGIGVGRFEYAAAPYMQSLPFEAFNEHFNYIFSPHSELFRFMAEDGIIVSLLLFVLFFSFIFPFQKLKKISDHCPESITFFIFFSVQFLFQYPLSQPFPLLLIPFVLASTFHNIHALQHYSIPSFQWVSRGLGVFFFFIALLLTASSYISLHYFDNTKLNRYVYRLWKDTQSLKSILVVSYVNKKYARTKKYALKELRREPQNLFALKYLGLSTLKEGDVQEGCKHLKVYDAVYRYQSSVHEEIEKECK